MALNDHLDNYCERLGPEFWSEPINAVTNAAFLVAAFAAFMLWRRKVANDTPALVLTVIVALIGIGSFLFHTFATRWAAIADVVPIMVFILVYLAFALRRFLELHWVVTIAIVIGFFVLAPMLGEVWAPILGSSAAYLPALLAIFVVGSFFVQKNRAYGLSILVTGVIFTVSIGFRMADEPVCHGLAIGTHFMWHILNAVVLYRLLRVLILHRAG
ncbi:hypothetical protein E1180_19955 [Roseibium denhamense]|uniref:Ceramidase n=1 Tax=Roseibium denhamense TaxID=76305 RepID=A0ABY1P6P2_9HYPH|nr:ceramidase domain-containing protein [Roseibium denhamense]MTI07782.1 hypothetical protein [Roseibium denhamense]SMP25338.1 Ceramidase [Roseibium denhamense]